jgi:eukaryotic-like serine/threonine-protein kinase
MALQPGSRLGHYQVVSSLGAGGMGEVYRAADTRLGREVAIKVLPESVAGHAERLTRFEREARVLASLNHVGIATLHGFETENGVPFLVMELVEGETLAERIDRGPIPIESALPLFLQIAEALEVAHEKGVVHRDLKPANVKVSPEGRVKVLDFGLAKALEPLSEAGGAGAPAPSLSPTLSLALTRRGEILGTASYMAPEQARGQPVDRRADVWAFGVCFFEALTGRRVFDGETVTDILARVLQGEPDWGDLPSRTPPALRDLLRRCLEKNARERLRDIGEARILIGRLLADPDSLTSSDSSVAGAPAAGSRRAVASWSTATWSTGAWSTGALAAGFLAGSLFFGVLGRPGSEAPADRRPVRFTVGDATGGPIAKLSDFALSPDGSQLVYVVGTGEEGLLYRRSLAEFDAEAAPLAGTEGAQYPFFSPDGESVGFFLGPGGQRTLSRVNLADGSVNPITRQQHSGYRAAWNARGELILGNQRDGLQILRPEAEALEFVIEPAAAIGGEDLDADDRQRGRLGEISGDAQAYLHPEWLPDGRTVLYTVLKIRGQDPEIALLDVETGETRTLIEGGSEARYSPSGHLVYGHRGNLRAVPFDAGRREITGESRMVVPGVRMNALGQVFFSLAADGTLAYVSGEAVDTSQNALAWLDEQGRELSILAEGFYEDVNISPDGRRIAATMMAEGSGETSIVVFDEAGNRARVTYQEVSVQNPVWHVDSRDLFFAGGMGPTRSLPHRITVDGAIRAAAPVTGVLAENVPAVPEAVSPDGRELIYTEFSRERLDYDVAAVDLERGERRILLGSGFNETLPRVSPDGRLLAYVSDREGERRVYVTTYPEPGAHLLVSPGLASYPRWSADGERLYYHSEGAAAFAARIEREPELRVGAREKLFDSARFSLGNGWDVAADGRFLMARVASDEEDPAGARIHVVLGFDQELRRRVPAR